MALITIAKWITLLSIFLSLAMKPIHGQQQQVPCLFFLGDSQFDNGNNNLLLTSAKANYPPYGIDYADGATGRFSNGRNIADYLGFEKPVPPFATAQGSDIIIGVNYASGGAGILEESGIQLGDRISLDRQLLNHRLTIARLSLLLSKQSSSVYDYLTKCLYAVNMGSNDYINNYLMPQFYPTSRLYTPDRFADILIQKFSGQLRTLYNTGARKVAVFGIGFLGCLPQELAMYPTNGSPCVDFINNDVELFNDRLKSLIDSLNIDLPNAQFIYINITSISSGDPSVIGIRDVNAPCCVVSRRTGQCAPNQVPCSNRNEYAFWDNFHPTEILNLVTASRAYNATEPTDATPTTGA
ncbi:UNVERIFIED_CONTAM: GDSL esterase/lipase [Sesamum radiatum]|uniref:GDSL esterase/lipase n=1 Tax=Sesamum radiatum TaxID=300843 RepID=A0AAW2KFG2_SESRA